MKLFRRKSKRRADVIHIFEYSIISGAILAIRSFPQLEKTIYHLIGKARQCA